MPKHIDEFNTGGYGLGKGFAGDESYTSPSLPPSLPKRSLAFPPGWVPEFESSSERATPYPSSWQSNGELGAIPEYDYTSTSPPLKFRSKYSTREQIAMGTSSPSLSYSYSPISPAEEAQAEAEAEAEGLYQREDFEGRNLFPMLRKCVDSEGIERFKVVLEARKKVDVVEGVDRESMMGR